VRSRAKEEIIREAESLIGQGFKELVLTGINTALYGLEHREDACPDDRKEKGEEVYGIEVIVKELNELPGDFRIRIGSLEPNVINREYAERLLKYERLCPHLHLSLQSGSDRILKEMNRSYTGDNFMELVTMLRKHDPGFGITTDIIIGFPGETEEDFEETLDLARQVRFDSAFTFLYSIRKGTPAERYTDQVPEAVKHERFNRLVELLNGISAEKNNACLGQVFDVLVEGPSKTDPGTYSGRTESGKLVNFRRKRELVGQIVPVRITEAKTFSLFGDTLT